MGYEGKPGGKWAHIKDRQATPPELVDQVLRVLNLRWFDVDVCAEEATSKGSLFWGKAADSLRLDWGAEAARRGIAGIVTFWMNPPYSSIGPWVEKALETAANGHIVVGCLPDDRSTAWYRGGVDQAHTLLVPTRRVNFIDPDTGETIKGNPKGTVIPVWGPWSLGGNLQRQVRIAMTATTLQPATMAASQ